MRRVAPLVVVAMASLGLAACSSSPSAQGAVVKVTDGASLQAALQGASPGEHIEMAPGTYSGNFSASAIGTSTKPITLAGPSGAVLAAGHNGYALHLDSARWWVLAGFSVRGGQKGIVLDHTDDTILEHLHVSGTQNEAVHLRAASSHDTIEHLQIDHTGLGRAFFGEGVYIGSALENWCAISSCGPDRSDDYRVLDSTFGPGIGSQNIDVKEGTQGGLIKGNTFSGVGTIDSNAWVQIKGNHWTIEGNHGSVSSDAGMQVLNLAPGWGRNNSFGDNVLVGPARGYAIWIQDGALDNTVRCSNTASSFRAGMTNVSCTTSSS